jgi:hypothetical protein
MTTPSLHRLERFKKQMKEVVAVLLMEQESRAKTDCAGEDLRWKMPP